MQIVLTVLGSTKERFGPFACNLVRLARCSWKLLSAVLAVSVDNGMHIYNVSDMDISLS